jgi:hypothetical protein
MTLIKITDFRLQFEHPIVLNPEKNYKLGVSHLMFSLDKSFDIHDFWFEFYIPIPDTTTAYPVKSGPMGKFTIDSLQNQFQKTFNDGFNGIIEQNRKDKKTELNNKLQKLKPSL